MSSDRARTAATLDRLNQDARLNLALDETVIRALADILDAHERDLSSTQINDMRGFIRDHRVGMIKQRAMMSAVGIDV